MRRPKIRVPYFGEKLAWSFENLVRQRVTPPRSGEVSPPADKREIQNPSNLWERMSRDAGDDWMPAREKWQADVRENHCSREILERVCHVFPELSIELLCTPDLASFYRAAEPLAERRKRYTSLGQYFLANRERLAAFSKHHYRTLDQAGDWPLISIPSWRPMRPIPFAENSHLDAFVPGAKFSPAQSLPGLNAKYSEIRRTIAPGSRVPHNGDCYRVISANFRNYPKEPIFSYGPCSYFDYHDTCEIHALKMSALERGEEDLIEFDLLDIAARAGVPGVNAFTVLLNFKAPGQRPGDFFLLHRRSVTTVQARNTLHVIPAGQHQPSQAYYGLDEDVSIWRTLVREFCEEAFNIPEAHSSNTSPGDRLLTKRFRDVIDPVFRSGAAKTHLLGFGLDPVTAKPEILASNVIDFRKMNVSDADRLPKFEANNEGEICFFKLSREQIRTQIELYRGDDLKWLPAGKACLVEFERNYDLLLAGA